jgi:hypothetical protein
MTEISSIKRRGKIRLNPFSNIIRISDDNITTKTCLFKTIRMYSELSNGDEG